MGSFLAAPHSKAGAGRPDPRPAESGKVWGRVASGEEMVVTRNGKPFALLLHTEPDEVEDAIRAWRAARFGKVLDRMQARAAATGAHRITAREIDAEIKAVRAERRHGSTTPSRR